MWRNASGLHSTLLYSEAVCCNVGRYNARALFQERFSHTTAAIGSSSTSPLKVRYTLGSVVHYSRCYWELSKANLSMLVVATSGTGFVLGSGRTIDITALFCTCAGTMMAAASASSLNQVFEMSNDAKMKRTMLRPLPSGRISLPHAVVWASCMGLAGTTLLVYKTNVLAAVLAASNIALYAFVYTPLKKIHALNTWVGAIVGAVPPLLGWVSASGHISLSSMLLPAALYFWQIPHFMALAFICRNDYAAGGFKMFSLYDATGKRTALVALRNCIYLVPLGFLGYDWGLVSWWFWLESCVLSLGISATAYAFYKECSMRNARRMFHASLLYLPIFMSGLLIHSNNLTIQEYIPHHKFQPLRHKSEEETTSVFGKNVDRHPFPPVAYASIAPFPFLPVPSSILTPL